MFWRKALQNCVQYRLTSMRSSFFERAYDCCSQLLHGFVTIGRYGKWLTDVNLLLHPVMHSYWFARWRDWYRDTSKTCLGGGMHCPCASRRYSFFVLVPCGRLSWLAVTFSAMHVKDCLSLSCRRRMNAAMCVCVCVCVCVAGRLRAAGGRYLGEGGRE